MYDLCFGEYPFFSYSLFPKKVPDLKSFFPLYAFPNEYLRIFSLGKMKTFFFPTNYSSKVFFKDTPISLLNNQKYESWSSNVISLPENIPCYSQTFVYKFDIISNIKRKPGIVNTLDQNFTLFSLKFTNPSLESTIHFKLVFDISANYTNTFTGNVQLKIKELKSGVTQTFKSIVIFIEESLGNSSNPEWLNLMNSKNFYTNKKLNDFGFFQVLSPQTIIFQV